MPEAPHCRPRISACVMTKNEEQNIRRCLESVRWCDEIVVLDSFSTDRTLDICREFTDRIFQQQWKGYIGQRNAIRDLASCEWLLFLDADEEVSPELRDEILNQFKAGPGPFLGFQFSRQVYYLGRWIRFGEWNPDIKLRLFRKDKGWSGGKEPHDMVFVDGPVKTLRGKLWHYTYEDIEHHLETMNRFSTISARSLFESGRKFRWSDISIRPAFRFFKCYFLKMGFLDGRRGFLIARIVSLSVAIKYAKLWELQNDLRMKPPEGTPESVGEEMPVKEDPADYLE